MGLGCREHLRRGWVGCEGGGGGIDGFVRETRKKEKDLGEVFFQDFFFFFGIGFEFLKYGCFCLETFSFFFSFIKAHKAQNWFRDATFRLNVQI